MERGSPGELGVEQNIQPNFETLEVIDGIIKYLYMPFRGQEGFKTERAILVEDAHVPHRENDAEHSWHLAFTCQVLYYHRQELGLEFPPDFNIDKAVSYAIPHDVPEIRSEDVDLMSPIDSHHTEKQQKELVAMEEMAAEFPWLKGIAELWHEYEPRDNQESQFVSDIDKLIALRMICHDGGKKWHDWEGYSTDRVLMLDKVGSKLFTNIGRQIFAAAEIDINNHPEYFPEPGDQAKLL